ncbi:MAG: hypothetical protein ABI261_04290 [Ginsengibacter sp.]
MISKSYFSVLLLYVILLCSCNKREKSISFYYWKTSFHLNPQEINTIRNNKVTTLYIRYFDIDMAPEDAQPKPVAPVSFDTTKLFFSIIPVIYIKNRVFERLDSAGISSLCNNVFKMVAAINKSIHKNPDEVQFDCDWTVTTKDKYFLFLRSYKALSKMIISSTIRLHQIKYPGITGIPPVDSGVLMYYNMGKIGTGESSSIYEKSIANKYNSFIKTYPLKLKAALPIFSWGQLISEDKVMKLLNGMNYSDFVSDTNFVLIFKNRFKVKHSNFHGGYYFKQNDEVKIEKVPEADLMEMIDQLNRESSGDINQIIFYDLDESNLELYDKNIFEKMVDRLN